MADYAYWIPLFPLASAFVIFFFGRWLPKKGAWLGILGVTASLAMSAELFLQWFQGSLKLPVEYSWPWFSAGTYPFEWGILVDGSTLIMLLVVTVVSFAVQVYSLGYMRDAPRFKRYYAYLSLFTFSMLALVLANNYLQFFVGWEVMGACSYFLIGFEFERESAAAAGNKAFITTKFGDLGFYAGLLTIFFAIGTYNFSQIQGHLHDGTVSPRMAFLIAMFLFSGAVGKSAQFPLHVWLPDAMEGPTPVSALIHAATMVAAGVYLVARSYGFFILAPQALEIVARVGGLTAIFAATIALTANDIKKVLAYSTISQLGYMMLALGVFGYGAGLFHLATHAAFKALLFLGAGSVIHAVHTNDIWKMGGLRKRMTTTAFTFMIGSLALAGIRPLAGFYSKEMILSVAYGNQHTLLFGVGCFTAFLTSFYMMRVCALVFLGGPREWDRFAHARESPSSMTIPLLILAVLAAVSGKFLMAGDTVQRLLEWPGTPLVEESRFVTGIASGSAIAGILLGSFIYLGRIIRPESLAALFRPVYSLFANKWYVDELYEAAFIRPAAKLSLALAWFDDHMVDKLGVDGTGWVMEKLAVIQGWFDDQAVDGAVDGLGWLVTGFGAAARRIQTGLAQNYLLIITLGFITLIFWKIF